MSVDTSSPVTNDFTLSLTERAAQRVRALIDEHDLPDTAGLRAGATEGGCSGYNYLIEMVERPEPGDVVVERHGARVFVNSFSRPLITGMTIDWISSMQESRFVVNNPNATGTCGCGVSFSV
jgi:iron-sulfur cluster assembly accessory protein